MTYLNFRHWLCHVAATAFVVGFTVVASARVSVAHASLRHAPARELCQGNATAYSYWRSTPRAMGGPVETTAGVCGQPVWAAMQIDALASNWFRFAEYVDSGSTLQHLSYSSTFWLSCARDSDNRPLGGYVLVSRSAQALSYPAMPWREYRPEMDSLSRGIAAHELMWCGSATTHIAVHASTGYLFQRPSGCPEGGCNVELYVSDWRP
jgi:hypothetical protein